MSGKKMLLLCEICGTVVARYPSTLKGSVYCSKACVGLSHRNGSTLFCALCDGKFYRRFGEQDLGVRVNQFCSRDCYMTHRLSLAKPTTYLKDGARHQHRVVVERFIGRPLTSLEVVHHIDLDKHNNSLSNLMLFPDSRTHMLCHWGKLSDAELRSFSLV